MTGAALLAISHGTDSVAGRRSVGALVAAVRAATVVPVLGGFVDVQPPRLPRVLADLPAAAPAVVVPLLLSAGYHVRIDIARAARRAQRPVAVAAALGPDDGLVRLLARRLAEAGSTEPDRVVLAAAGSSDAAAVRDCRDVAARLAGLLGRPVTVGFLSAAEPRLAAVVDAARHTEPAARVAIATYLLAPGYFHGLVQAAGADVVAAPLLDGSGVVAAELLDAVLARYAAATTTFPSASTDAR